ncbi:unnamed protein product [Sphenostylis stenocarpa]|uniref:Protein kinase domain-containing protein n=1 Tax=Sphenostylis stenocarpa TaxID=92480 RepID=A0AA86SWX8_9FABA|nr:unnamed protein product [Sphenostylis stenocarpa]
MGEIAVSVVSMLLLMVGLTMGMGLSSRTEWFALRELRSSLGIRAKYWPIKAEPCGNWTGVECRQGRVVGINLSGLRRTRLGRLNRSFEVGSLVNLTLLESFNASGFVLNGSIPEWLGERLRVLEVLDLRFCSVTGLIPESIGGLSVLRVLVLSGNSLTGRMPSTLGNLTRLSVLDLSGNSLLESVPDSVSKLRNLTRLDLSNNYLSGSVPPELGALSSLQKLNLSGNAFTGSVPSQLGNLSELVGVDLSMNFLSGQFPDGLFSSRLLALEVLILRGNSFDGALPNNFKPPRLNFLDVSSNNLTGTLPNFASWNDSSGVVFNLSNNLFYGLLNTSLYRFKTMDLSSNYLEGDEGGGNVILDRNCLQMTPNQRNLEECRDFYGARNLPFAFPESKSGSRRRVVFILVGIFGGLGFIAVLTLVLVLVLKQCKNRRSLEVERGTKDEGPVQAGESPIPPKDVDFVTGVGEAFSSEHMLHLTGNFAEENIIKYGHSGVLFLGVLEGRATVVVKRIDLKLFKRESYVVELELLSKVSHARLVPILGHCLENENEKCIVYKYMPNSDLATSLHRVTGSDGKLQSLDWITRLKIAIGAAEGLAYLHECSPPLVHRDVQASSILLDDKFEVRLGSLSQVTAQGDLQQGVISRVFSKPSASNEGDPGKSSATCAYDVYCFGKILLELITGNIEVSKSEDASTKEWLEQTLPYITLYDKERVTKIVDPQLIVDEDLLEEVWAMAIVANACLNPKPSKRPPMRHVLKALENPLKIVREENTSSEKLRTNSSRKSWSTAFFGSWRHSSSDSVVAATHTNKEGTSDTKKSRVGSQSSGNDHSSSNKRSSNEIFPEPLEMQDVETGEAR